MKNTLIAGVLTLSALLSPLASVHAATVTAGTLVKSSAGASVYYVASNGKRYVFPNEKTFKTWYPNFTGVQVISSADLGNLAIGGNATYRPGVRLLKIESDPKVYAVDTNRRLRWISSEAAAIALYGSDWNKQVDDLPDSFFVNYQVGANINSSSDFNKAAAMSAEATLDASINAGLSL